MRILTALLLLASAWTTIAHGEEWDVSANLGMQARLFAGQPDWPGQDSASGQFALTATTEFRWRDAMANQRASLIPHLRWDSKDDERSQFDLREAFWAFEGDRFEWLVGMNTVFWGVTESVHLVDVINQADIAADIDGEVKLGQPMVNLTTQRDWGLVSLYLMPYFRERTFPGTDGRLRPPAPVADSQARYESSSGRHHLDFALRYSHYFGDVDIGLSYFRGTSREPRLLPGDGQLVPWYDQVSQVGVDLQYTREAWLWKLEAIARTGRADTFIAAVGGFEYTLFQVADSAVDLGLLLEYQHDGRSADEPPVVNDNDIFAGARLALNDAQDTSLLAGLTHDPRTGETLVNVEAERRLWQDYVIELRARIFGAAEPGERLHAVAADDYVQIQLNRYF